MSGAAPFAGDAAGTDTTTPERRTPGAASRVEIVAIVLAGGGSDDPLARAHGVPARALVEVEGRSLAARVVAALAASRSVARTVLIASEPVARAVARETGLAAPTLHRVPPGRSFGDSLALGLGAASLLEPAGVLVVTADLPWLTPEGVDRFVARARAVGFPPSATRTAGSGPSAGERAPAVIYPVISRATHLAAFPGQRRTWVTVRGLPGATDRPTEVTGGNAVLVAPAAIAPLIAVAGRAHRARKNPLALARMVGPAFVAALLFGRLQVREVERRIGELLGVAVRTLPTDLAELGADVDRAEHLGAPPTASATAGRDASQRPTTDLPTAPVPVAPPEENS